MQGIRPESVRACGASLHKKEQERQIAENGNQADEYPPAAFVQIMKPAHHHAKRRQRQPQRDDDERRSKRGLRNEAANNPNYEAYDDGKEDKISVFGTAGSSVEVNAFFFMARFHSGFEIHDKLSLG